MRDRLEIVGRDDEIEQIRAFVRLDGPAAFVVEGEPGIGKTTLCQEVVAQAASQGRTILTARPTGAEAAMAFSGMLT